MKRLQNENLEDFKSSPMNSARFISAKDREQHGTTCLPSTQDYITIRSLEVLGSSICSERKLSAFSIYYANSTQSQQSVEEAVSLEEKYQRAQKCQSQEDEYSEQKQKRELVGAETKNLNRFFRSKINEMLREIRDDPQSSHEDRSKAKEILAILNQSNKIMFKEIREVIQDPWLQEKFSKCRSVLLKYIHKGKMGVKSKFLMLKYFNKILAAIKYPGKFQCWK